MLNAYNVVVGPKSKEEEEMQRESYFLTRAYIGNKLCAVMIDGSCGNFVSSLFVRESGLPTQKHPNPYLVIGWSDSSPTMVTEQVLVPISIECYADVILCDVIPMTYCHVSLGRSWQYNRRTFHDGYKNTYSFRFCHKMVTLYPFYSAQTQIKIKRDAKISKQQETTSPKEDSAKTAKPTMTKI